MLGGVVSLILRSVEFFRSGFGKWITLAFEKVLFFKIFALPLLIWGMIRFFISMFSSVCESIRNLLSSINFNGLHVGGVDVLALANSVLPLDEIIGLLVAWFAVAAVVASIRFIRAAWSAIPLKAS